MPNIQYCEDCKNCIRKDSYEKVPHEFSRCGVSKINDGKKFVTKNAAEFNYCATVRKEKICKDFQPKGE